MEPAIPQKAQSLSLENKESPPPVVKRSSSIEAHKKLSPKAFASNLFGRHTKNEPVFTITPENSLSPQKVHKISKKDTTPQKIYHQIDLNEQLSTTTSFEREKNREIHIQNSVATLKKYSSAEPSLSSSTRKKPTKTHSLSDLNTRFSSSRKNQIKTSKSLLSTTEKDATLHRYSDIKQKKAIERFDKSMVDKLEKHWKVTQKPHISSKKINNDIYLFCRSKIFNLAMLQQESDFYNLYKTASLHAPLLLKAIQNTNITLHLISQRLEVFYEAVCRWHEFGYVKTQSSAKLQSWLANAIQIDIFPTENNKIHEIKEFLTLFEEFNDQFSEELIHHIYKAFGDTAQEIEQTIATLKMWSADCEKTKTKAFAELNTIIKQACMDIILAKKTTEIGNSFSIPQEYIEILKNITPAEVRRCIMPLHQTHILFKKIVVNGSTIHDEKQPQRHFWENFYKKIYEKFEVIPKKNIKKQMSYFESIGDSIEKNDVDKKIPCFQILRLMSNSCWGVGDLFFRRFFPGLTKPPYWLKAAKGIYCYIRIGSSQNYSVTQLKTYIFYPLLNPLDKTTTMVDEKRPLARLLIDWTTSVKKEKWRGKITVVDIEMLKSSCEEDKWAIYDTLSDLTHINRCSYLS